MALMPPVTKHPEGRLRQLEAGAGSGQHDVGVERPIEPGANGPAVHCRNHRLRQSHQGAGHRLHQNQVFLGRRSANIASRAERAPAAAQQHGTDGHVACHMVERARSISTCGSRNDRSSRSASSSISASVMDRGGVIIWKRASRPLSSLTSRRFDSGSLREPGPQALLSLLRRVEVDTMFKRELNDCQ